MWCNKKVLHLTLIISLFLKLVIIALPPQCIVEPLDRRTPGRLFAPTFGGQVLDILKLNIFYIVLPAEAGQDLGWPNSTIPKS